MANKVAVIGFPYSGKTTAWQAICQVGSGSLNTVGEFGERVGTLKTDHDERMLWLCEHEKSRKRVPLSMEVWDYPGLDLTTEATRQQARRLMASVRQCDLLLLVVRGFDNPSVSPYRNRVNPAADVEEMMDEFVFADMDQLTRRAERIEAQIKKPTPDRDKLVRELTLVKNCLTALENNEGLETVIQTNDDRKMLSSLALLTQRPVIVLVSVGEDQLDQTFEIKPYPMIKSTVVCAGDYEQQLIEMTPEDRQSFMGDVGITTLIGTRLTGDIMKALEMLIFYTTGEDETRMWPITSGTTAVEAAGKIHSDIARGFIRAETVHFDDLKAAGSYKDARAAGKLRLEGKDYVVRDGDIIVFRFNV
jgi:GTP-binding protein YchF